MSYSSFRLSYMIQHWHSNVSAIKYMHAFVSKCLLTTNLDSSKLEMGIFRNKFQG